MALEKETKRRLMKLIEFMESLPKSAEKHFKMYQWFQHKGKGHHEELEDGARVEKKHYQLCGTTACALGWAASMPYFRRLGLSMTLIKGFDGKVLGTMEFKGCEVGCDDTASSGLFELTERQSMQLFGPWNKDKTQKAWAKRARGLIEKFDREKPEAPPSLPY